MQPVMLFEPGLKLEPKHIAAREKIRRAKAAWEKNMQRLEKKYLPKKSRSVKQTAKEEPGPERAETEHKPQIQGSPAEPADNPGEARRHRNAARKAARARLCAVM